jgi:type IV secretory pathway TrbL component
MSIEDDPVLGRFFDTPEKKAKWIARIKIAYIIWILFMMIGILAILLWYLILE